MSKHVGSGGDEPPSKRQCTIDVQGKLSFGTVDTRGIHECDTANQAVVPLALLDNGAWEILSKFLTMSMSLSEVDDAHMSYLGDRYLADDWVEPRRLLFSGDADNAKSLKNFTKLQKTYIPDLPAKSSVRVSASRTNNYSLRSHTRKSHKLSKVSWFHDSDIYKLK